LAIQNQRDAAGLIVFDDEIRAYVRPSTRQGQLVRLLSGLEQAEPRARTNSPRPLNHFQQFLRRRGIVVFILNFYESPEQIVRTIEPCASTEMKFYSILDPKEIRPDFREPAHARRSGNPGTRRDHS